MTQVARLDARGTYAELVAPKEHGAAVAPHGQGEIGQGPADLVAREREDADAAELERRQRTGEGVAAHVEAAHATQRRQVRQGAREPVVPVSDSQATRLSEGCMRTGQGAYASEKAEIDAPRPANELLRSTPENCKHPPPQITSIPLQNPKGSKRTNLVEGQIHHAQLEIVHGRQGAQQHLRQTQTRVSNREQRQAGKGTSERKPGAMHTLSLSQSDPVARPSSDATVPESMLDERSRFRSVVPAKLGSGPACTPITTDEHRTRKLMRMLRGDAAERTSDKVGTEVEQSEARCASKTRVGAKDGGATAAGECRLTVDDGRQRHVQPIAAEVHFVQLRRKPGLHRARPTN